mgnify:CR=1 FL=1
MYDEDGNSIICRLPGRFKNKYHLKQNKQRVLDIVTVGDRVKISINDDGRGEIKKILDRENYFSRKAPRLKGTSGKGERLEQIFAANIDNIVIVASANQPSFNNRLIDRITVAAESSHIGVIIVINKSDIGTAEEIEDWKEIYTACGYNVVVTSVINNKGIYQLGETIKDSTNLFCGQSGVGKSKTISLLSNHTVELKTKKIGKAFAKVVEIMNPKRKDALCVECEGEFKNKPILGLDILSGLKKDDVIINVDGVRITSYADLTGFLNTKRPDDVVNVTYVRDNEEYKTNVVLSKNEISKVSSLGLELKNLDTKELKKLKIGWFHQKKKYYRFSGKKWR